MADRLPPLPLESRNIADRPPGGRPFRISGVSAVAQIGLCLSAIGVPVYAALSIAPTTSPALALYERATAGFGFAAMAALAAICVGLLRRASWSRRAMLAFSATLFVWECLKLPIALFFYAPGRRRVLVDALERQLAAATQPTSRPAYFDSFGSIGVYVFPILTFLALGGFAFWSMRIMRTDSAKRIIGS